MNGSIAGDINLKPDELLELLDDARANGTLDSFKALLQRLPETLIDAAFEDASREERLELLELMPAERAASTFTDLPLSEQAELLPNLPADRLRLIGAFVGPDEIADLLGVLQDNEISRAHLLSSLTPTLARSALELEQYPEDRAGGIMTPEFVALREGMTVHQALAFLRLAADQAETVAKLYLVDAGGRLTGMVALEALVTAPPGTHVDHIAQRDIFFAQTSTDQEDVARLMRDYDLNVLPVVDEGGVLKGIVTIDDVLDVLEEEATEDIYKGAAMEGSEIDYLRTSSFALWRKRVFWLAALSISEFLTANVISSYETALKSQAILAAFIPALIGTGGNTGSQSAILVVRALATGQIRPRDALQVLSKEFGTGVLLGLALAVFAYLRVSLFYSHAGTSVAFTVAFAILAIVIVANIIGGMLPILFHKLRIDPAVTSSPFLATLMDATGLLIYFNIARLIIGT